MLVALDQTVVAWCGCREEQQFVFQSCSFFFLRDGVFCCLAVFPVLRLSCFYLLIEVVNVRLEWNILCARCQTLSRDLPVCVTATCWRSLILLCCFFCSTWGTLLIGTRRTTLTEWKMFYKIISALTGVQLQNYRLMQSNGCRGRKRPFYRIRPSQTQHCEVSGIFRECEVHDICWQ